MTELEALRRVAEAARAWVAGYQSDEGATVDHRLAIIMAVRDLDALPTEAPGEMVEIRQSVWRHRKTGELEPTSERANMNRAFWEHIATITARVPLPRIPEIVATVEAGE